MGPTITEGLLRDFIAEENSAFLSFIENSKSHGRWLISSDFCMDDPTYSTKTCAVSIIPLDEHPQDISDRIGSAIPKDLKKTKVITSETIELFKDERMFHFVFILSGHREIISQSSELEKLEATRAYILKIVDFLKEKNCPPTILKPFKSLLEKSKAKKFNVDLFSDMIAISSILGFISAALIRQGANLIGLFPDRDCVTDWCDGIYSDFVQMYVGGVLESVEGKSYQYEIKRAINGSWLDSFVRLPDFLAGVIAGWDLANNTIIGDKREKLFMANIVDAKNIKLIHLLYDGEFHLEHVTATGR
ncbi:hypothetical protein [Pseudomonas sp. S3_E04]